MYYNRFINGCMSVEREFARVLQMPNDEDISQIKMNKSYSRCRTSFEIFISSLL
jgi:hypothetical protein